MYWVEKRLEQRAELRASREKLNSGTEPIWESLCQAMSDSIKAYEKKEPYGRFEQDGKNHHLYWVRYVEDTPNHNTEIRKVTVVLDGAKGTITATYKGKKHHHEPRLVRLAMHNGDICLKNDGTPLQSAGAAAYLLDPFLFPDLEAIPIPYESVYENRAVTTLQDTE